MRAQGDSAKVMIVSLILLTGVLAGCLQDEDDEDENGNATPVSVDWPRLALPYGEGHTHEALDAHRALSTPNFELLGWDPLITDYHGTTSGDHLCGGVSKGEQELAVSHSFNTDVAFVLADVTDPSAPEKLGEFIIKRAHTYDVDITPDGHFVVIGTNPDPEAEDDPLNLLELLRGPHAPSENNMEHLLATGESRTVEVSWRDACTGETTLIHEELPLAPGTVLVDVRDPQNPEFADFKPAPVLGPHSIHAATTDDGTTFVLASITNLAHQSSYFTFYTIEPDGLLGPMLMDYGVVTAEYVDPDTQHPLVNGHVDGWIATHPGTGQNLAYLANWNGGLLVAQLAGVGQVEVIGAWNDYTFDAPDPEHIYGDGMTGAIHTAYPLSELWDDKHYTVIGQEVVQRPAGRPTGQMILMDTTDPTAPEPVARWTLPYDPGDWGGGDEFLLYSTHYATVVDDVMFVAMYHGGVWAVDLDPTNWPELGSLGVYIPDQRSPQPPGEALPLLDRWTPIVLDVVRTRDGDLVIWDGTSGIYAVRFDAQMEIPMPEPWTEDAWIE